MLLIVFLSFILFNYRIASKISNKNFDEILITGFAIQSGSIILTGYLLSSIHYWDSTYGWSIVPFFTSYLIYYFFKYLICLPESSYKSVLKLVGSSVQKLHTIYKNQRKSEKLLFGFVFFGILGIALIQLFLMFYLPPNEWDSMTGHLNRILYFAQNHTTAHFVGTNWNVDTYPKSFSSIQYYPFIMSGYNEHFFKLPNLSAYWMLFIASYAIQKQLEIEFKIRLLSSMLILLTPIVLIQSTTTDTDIVLGAYLASCLYFLFRYIKSQQTFYIYLFSFVFAIALSHKITFLFSVPSLGILLIYSFIGNKITSKINQIKHIVKSLFFVVIVSLPTGYISNVIHYGHPIGPETATKHQSIERAGNLASLLIHGSKNVARYLFDLLNFDGLRNITKVEYVQEAINNQFRKLDTTLNWGLESSKTFTIVPFNYTRHFDFYNGTPIYGSIFLLILIPSIILLLSKRRKPIYYLIFSAFIFHFIALAFSAAYDPWKGRYMISSLVFILPITSILFEKIVSTKKYIYALPIFLVIVVSAYSTLLFHSRGALLSTHEIPTIWNKSRMEHLTVSRPDITKAYMRFDSIVPLDATVALATINDDYEYPLWGKEFSRKLVPINPFEKGLQPIPKEANYLFFSKNVVKPRPTDIRLGTDTTVKEHIIVRGEDYYLRKLK